MRRINGLLDCTYSVNGRESIPPERLLRAQFLHELYTIYSEWQLVEQINYNLLFHWFIRLSIDDEVVELARKRGFVKW